MADVKTSALTAASSVDPADLLMAVDVSDTTMAASGTNKKATREQLQTYAAGTLTTDKKVLDLSATWNAAGVTFTGVKLNVTDTASAAASLLLDIQKGSASQFVINKDGNVGIGTGSPGAKLDISGGSGATGVQAYFSVNAGYAAPAAANASFSGGTKQVFWNDTVTPQKLSIGMDSNATMWFANAGAQASGASTAGGFNFYTSQSASGTPSVVMRIDSSGNVGIGTSSPGYKLDVESNPIRVAAASSGAGYIQYGKSATAANNWHLGSEGDGNFRLWNGNYGAGSLRMSIDSSGNVGIGTSSPTDGLLHLNGGTSTNIKFTNSATGTSATDGFFLGLSSSGDPAAYIYQREASDIIFGANNTERMRISSSGNLFLRQSSNAANTSVSLNTTVQNALTLDSSGNVGIGTSSPGAKFEVYAASNPELRVNDGTVNFQLYAGTGTSNAVMGTVGAHALVMRTNATERMRIDSSGNVIVNTAAVATSATAGFLWIPSCAGAPTGAPTAPYTNAAALVADTTNNRLYVLVAGTWKYASLT